MEDYAEFLRRRFPKTGTDWLAFLVLAAGVHAVLIFELFVVLPFLYDGFHDSVVMYYTHIVAALFLYVNVVSNMALVMVTETGIRGMILPSGLKPGWRFCSVCECNAPPRSYHCNICGTCVLKRDHHCTFAGCCVGHSNQRYFMVMIFWIWVASVYASVMNLDVVYHIFGEYSLKTLFVLVLPLLAWMFQVVETVTMTMAFMISLCIIALLMTSALLGYHMINIVNGQTVYEKTYKIHTYNVGVLQNLKEVFGENWTVSWIWPWIASPLPGNGIQFTERQKDH
ncbi:putative palmitoyltransferase ZDHHC24 [Babylonia areolata]|uniref:putative palmitoyltransferase ZDHHC24 n=1 Tax=Babylonia areolata TaxID=304850 RepID=UPI003FCEEDD7